MDVCTMSVPGDEVPEAFVAVSVSKERRSGHKKLYVLRAPFLHPAGRLFTCVGPNAFYEVR